MNSHAELEKYLRITARIAEAQLKSNNRMHFGVVFDSDGNARMLVPESMKENVTWDELVTHWKQELGKAAPTGRWKAVSSCTFASYCAFGEIPSQDSIADVLEVPQSILIHIEHCDPGLCAEDVAFRYEGSMGSEVRIGEATRATSKRWLSVALPAQS